MTILSLISKGADWLAGTSAKDVNNGKPIEGTGLKNLGAGLENAAIAVPLIKAVEVPGLVAKGALAVKSGAGALISSIGKTISANPVKSTIIGVAGAGYVAKDPVQAVKDTSSIFNTAIPDLYNYGGNIAELRGDPSIANVEKIFTENPLLAGATVAGVGIAGYYGIKAVQGFSSIGSAVSNSSSIGETVNTAKNIIANTPSAGGNSQSLSTPATSNYATPADNTGLVSYENKDTVTKKATSRRKPKHLYKSPINIRNNILIQNKNG